MFGQTTAPTTSAPSTAVTTATATTSAPSTGLFGTGTNNFALLSTYTSNYSIYIQLRTLVFQGITWYTLFMSHYIANSVDGIAQSQFGQFHQ